MMENICICQSGENPRTKALREVIGYGKSEFIYVDYRFPAIVKLRRYGEDDHTYIYPKDQIPIRFCPYCGRDLKLKEKTND